jgi:excinuclease ABC subunit C
MVVVSQKITDKIKFLPELAGIYLWKDKNDNVIYVGKAKNLKNRIKTYLTHSDKDAKTSQLISNAVDLVYLIVNSENEAFILEANFIKKYKPKYNILLKDDKRYPFIKITLSEPFPRILVTRDLVKDGGKYFGPYTDTRSLRKTLRLLEWIVPLRSCKRIIMSDKIGYSRACINYQLGKCPAPCVGYITKEAYWVFVQRMISFFTGKLQELKDDFRLEMQLASEEQNYETAAIWRDRLVEMDKIQKRQYVFYPDQRNIDIIGFYQEQSIAFTAVLRMVNGNIINQENYPLSQIENSDASEILAAFLKLYYSDKDELPNEIILPHKPTDYDELNLWLHNKLVLPQRGEKTKLLIMAKKNAFHLVEERKLAHLKKANRTILPIQELKEKLGLTKLPRKIVCMDISTIQGNDTVSSAVFFENGKPLKKYYRHFIIRSIDTQNDFAAMAETITRFICETQKDENLTPDLIIIDGGKGQLNSALQILESGKVNIPVISLAKRIEEIFIPHSSDSIILAKSSISLRLITNIRDEAHRFAINFHRQRRSKRTLISELEAIEGIGEMTKFMLIKELGSVDAIKNATFENLISIKGIGENTAKKIIEYFNKFRQIKL